MPRAKRKDSRNLPGAIALGKLIQETRTGKFSQQELATRAELSIGTLRALEQGHSVDPSFFTVMAVANELGIGLEKLTTVACPKPATEKTRAKQARTPPPERGAGER